jgi:hypothetical protein
MGKVLKSGTYHEGEPITVKTNEQLQRQVENLQHDKDDLLDGLTVDERVIAQLETEKAELVEALKTALLFGQIPSNIVRQVYGVYEKYKREEE